jgi:hypothetical protein
MLHQKDDAASAAAVLQGYGNIQLIPLLETKSVSRNTINSKFPTTFGDFERTLKL